MNEKELNIQYVKVSDIKFTKNNARKITDESMDYLSESVDKLGIIRPLILNDKMELMSGNERTKTMIKLGVKEAPAVIIEDVSVSNYINFTLLVNSIENNYSEVYIKNPDSIPYNQFFRVDTNMIETKKRRNPVLRRDVATSVVRYGQWGSVIVAESGECIFNSDYATTMQTIGYPLYVYKVDKEQEKFIKEYFFKEYGVYCYDDLNLLSYPQTYVQPNRTVNNGRDVGMRSVMYDEIASESLEHTYLRFLDFGSGKKLVPNYFKKEKGCNIQTYEPFYKVVGNSKDKKTYFDIKTVVSEINAINEDINKNGLYDVVISEAVLNSTVSKNMELYVIATCSSLTSDNGVFYVSSRSLKRLMQFSNIEKRGKKATDNSKRTFELDENGMYVSYRRGFYNTQKHHDEEKLSDTLKMFFGVVEQVFCTDKFSTAIFFKCSKPKKIDEKFLEEALNEEFNFEYPQGYKHNKHKVLVETILKKNKERKI